MTEIVKIVNNKKEYLNLLLIADEQEDMIDEYLDRGDMYVLKDTDVIAECVVTDESDGVLEIKNLAVSPCYQKMGYGRYMIDFIAELYKEKYDRLIVGTGEAPSTLDFYKKCGFQIYRRVKDFFVINYNHPIYEDGIKLTDMVYLQKFLFCTN